MNDDFDAMYGKAPVPRPSFAERLGKPHHEEVNEPTESTVGGGAYKPYGFLPVGNVGAGCEVFGWVAGTEIVEGIAFQYRFLMEVTFTGDEMIRLMLPDCVVVIEGRFLTELRRKLMRGVVTFIRQYNRLIWPPPPPGETIVERIEVVRPGRLNMK